MNHLLRKIIEDQIRDTHQDNERLILDRNEAVMKGRMLSEQISANMQYIGILKRELERIRSPDPQGLNGPKLMLGEPSHTGKDENEQ